VEEERGGAGRRGKVNKEEVGKRLTRGRGWREEGEAPSDTLNLPLDFLRTFKTTFSFSSWFTEHVE
jgi:hypothetical protein